MLGGNVVLKEEDRERTPMSSAKQGWNQKGRGWRDKGLEVVLGVVDRGWTWRCLPYDNDVLKD